MTRGYQCDGCKSFEMAKARGELRFGVFDADDSFICERTMDLCNTCAIELASDYGVEIQRVREQEDDE